jgi:hypothetical protein
LHLECNDGIWVHYRLHAADICGGNYEFYNSIIFIDNKEYKAEGISETGKGCVTKFLVAEEVSSSENHRLQCMQ